MYIPNLGIDLFLTWLQDDFKQETFEALLANWVATTDQPFDTTESPKFRELLQYLYQKTTDLHIPGRHSIRNRITKMGDTTVTELKQMFAISCLSHCDRLSLTEPSQQHTGKISISLDAWTSKNQIAFLAIVTVTAAWLLSVKPSTFGVRSHRPAMRENLTLASTNSCLPRFASRP